MYTKDTTTAAQVQQAIENACELIIQSLTLINDTIHKIEDLDEKELRVLALALSDGWVSDEWLRLQLAILVTKTGQKCFRETQNKSTTVWADHVSCPAALAYVIKHQACTPSLLATIPLDHGDTLESFARRADGFVENLFDELNQILNGINPVL